MGVSGENLISGNVFFWPTQELSYIEMIFISVLSGAWSLFHMIKPLFRLEYHREIIDRYFLP
jgi:hypothetical protein